MPAVEPGQAVRGSRTGRPIMVLLDLLGRTWALRILWELRDGRSLVFRDLSDACGKPSPSVLNKRLKELRHAGFVEHVQSMGYRVTLDGHQLIKSLGSLQQVADKWAERTSKT